jgi:hypothetical protein
LCQLQPKKSFILQFSCNNCLHNNNVSYVVGVRDVCRERSESVISCRCSGGSSSTHINNGLGLFIVLFFPSRQPLLLLLLSIHQFYGLLYQHLMLAAATASIYYPSLECLVSQESPWLPQYSA